MEGKWTQTLLIGGCKTLNSRKFLFLSGFSDAYLKPRGQVFLKCIHVWLNPGLSQTWINNQVSKKVHQLRLKQLLNTERHSFFSHQDKNEKEIISLENPVPSQEFW